MSRISGGRTNGEIIVFNVTGGKFRICARISNKPYDAVGCWYVKKFKILLDRCSGGDIIQMYCVFLLTYFTHYVGSRYGNSYVISSDFKWLAHLISASQLWTNKVDLSEEDQNDYTLAGMRRLFSFYNQGANAVRHMLVAECPKALSNGKL